MQDSLPAGWLAFTGRELNPLDCDERFPSCYISFPFPGFILTLTLGDPKPPWPALIHLCCPALRHRKSDNALLADAAKGVACKHMADGCLVTAQDHQLSGFAREYRGG